MLKRLIPVAGLAFAVAAATMPLTMAGAAGNITPAGALFGSGNNGNAASSGSAVKINLGDGGHAAQLTSVNYGYGLVSVKFPTRATFADLTSLSTDYNVTQGTCNDGSPRFQVDVLPAGDNNLNDASSFYVYFGTQPYGGCTTGTQSFDAVGAAQWLGPSNSFLTFAQAKQQYGSWRLLDAQIAVDAGWGQTNGTQQVQITNWNVAGRTYFDSSNSGNDS